MARTIRGVRIAALRIATASIRSRAISTCARTTMAANRSRAGSSSGRTLPSVDATAARAASSALSCACTAAPAAVAARSNRADMSATAEAAAASAARATTRWRAETSLPTDTTAVATIAIATRGLQYHVVITDSDVAGRAGHAAGRGWGIVLTLRESAPRTMSVIVDARTSLSFRVTDSGVRYLNLQSISKPPSSGHPTQTRRRAGAEPLTRIRADARPRKEPP
ncbi:hypothetical protein OB08_07820 [Microbacterium sp. HJ5]